MWFIECPTERYSPGPNGAVPEEWPATARGEGGAAHDITVPSSARHAHCQYPPSGPQGCKGIYVYTTHME